MAQVDDLAGRSLRASESRASVRAVSRPGRLTARVHTHVAEVETLWRAMERASQVTLHQTYDWCAAWAAMPGIETRIVVVELDGRPAVLLPLEIVTIAGIKVARLIGTKHSNANSPIFSTAFLEAADAGLVDDLVTAIRGLAIGADTLAIDKLRPLCGDFGQPLLTLPHAVSQNPTFQLPLLATFEATLAQINAKRRRKKFRVSHRRLEPLGGYRHTVASDEAMAQALLTEFFRQKAVRLQAQGLPDVFAEPGVQDAFRRLAGFTGGPPVLAMHAIVLEGENEGVILALAGLTEKDGHVTCQFGSIDDAKTPDASVGELLFYLMIEQAVLTGKHTFDFGVGDQPYKRSWCPVMTEHHDIFLPLNAKGRIGALALSSVVRMKRFVKTSPALKAVAARLRGLAVKAGKPSAEADD